MKMFGVDVITIEPGIFRTGINNDDRMLRLMDEAWDRLDEEMKREYGDECFQRGTVKWIMTCSQRLVHICQLTVTNTAMPTVLANSRNTFCTSFHSTLHNVLINSKLSSISRNVSKHRKGHRHIYKNHEPKLANQGCYSGIWEKYFGMKSNTSCPHRLKTISANEAHTPDFG